MLFDCLCAPVQARTHAQEVYNALLEMGVSHDVAMRELRAELILDKPAPAEEAGP